MSTGVGSVYFVGRLLDATTIFTLGDIKLGLKAGAVTSDTLILVAANGGTVAFARELYLGITIALFVDVGVSVPLVATRFVRTVLNVDVDFFLSVDTRVRERSGDSSIFPSDARSAINVNFSFYSGASSLRDSVTPVRRREDTEGDGDASVKVQIDCPLVVLSRLPFELLNNNSKGEKRLET